MPLQAQEYTELPENLWLSMDASPPVLVFVEDKNTKEKVPLKSGCYFQETGSFGDYITFKFCITKEQVINGTYSIKDADSRYETRIYIENSIANKSELHLSGQLAETMLSSYKDSIMTIKNYTDKMQLVAERNIYFTAKDSAKSITKKYDYNEKLEYIDNEITGKLEEFDKDGLLLKLTEVNPNDKNEVTTTFFENGKKKSMVKDANLLLSSYQEQYDENENLSYKKYFENHIEITENYENGMLSHREQWFTEEDKRIFEDYKNGVLISKEIIKNHYLDNQVTEYYNAKNVLLKTEKHRRESGYDYLDTYDAKGKLIKSEKIAGLTGDGSKAPEKSIPPPLPALKEED